MSQVTGKVAQIIGPVVDVAFESGSELPKIYDSLEITNADGTLLVLEVQSHIGENMVRTISMDSTDGLSRGVDAVATGAPIQMPIGDDIYGRLFNVIGDAIDGIGNLPKAGDNGLSIHRSAPKFEDLSTSTEVLFLVPNFTVPTSNSPKVFTAESKLDFNLSTTFMGADVGKKD